jgi:hypothetical protein
MLFKILLAQSQSGRLAARHFTHSVAQFVINVAATSPDSSELFDLLEFLGKSNPSPNIPGALRRKVLAELSSAPQRRGLIALLRIWHRRENLHFLNEMPGSVFEFCETDEPIVRAAVSWLRFLNSNGRADEVPKTAHDILVGMPSRALAAADMAVNVKELDQVRVADLVREMCSQAAASDLEVHGDLLVILKRIADARQSNMESSLVAKEFELPDLQNIAASVAAH